jgi:hypothetical protein
VGPYSIKDAAPAMKIGTTMLPIFMFIGLCLSLSTGLVKSDRPLVLPLNFICCPALLTHPSNNSDPHILLDLAAVP